MLSRATLSLCMETIDHPGDTTVFGARSASLLDVEA